MGAAGMLAAGLLALAAGMAASYWWLLLLASRIPGTGIPPAAPGPPRARFLVLVPAHDEEAVLGPTLRALRERAAEASPGTVRVVVIADRCADRTAAVAREAAGVELLERREGPAGGKGAALAWALRRLDRPGEEWDALVVLDADTRPLPGFFPALARGLAAGWRVQQAACRSGNPGAGAAAWLGDLGRFAEVELFHAGKDRLGLAVFLLGTGMCLGREALARVPFRETGLAEDTAYSLRLLAAGERIRLNREARVETLLPEGRGAFRVQRGRWASGAIRLLAGEAPRLALRGVVRGDPRLVDAAWTLFAVNRPLVALCALLALPAALLAGGDPALLAAAGLPLLEIGCWVLAASWIHSGPREGTRRLLAAVPAAGTLLAATVAGFLPGRRAWRRTPRGEEADR